VPKGQRTARNKEYQKWYRANPANHKCDCGQPSIKHSTCGFVCARCLKLEDQAAQNYVVGSRALSSERWGNQHGNHRTKIQMRTDSDRGENRFIATIREIGNELVVIGHGEHHLRLGAA